ncbi:MAG: DUF1684 domain-containing protein, partial [Ignavibacteria bacterium]|nr:DUF1684 domain-containing protein [Ignavibacteria bacterium]
MKNKIISKIILLSFSLVLISCGENYTPEEKKYIAEIEKLRKENDDYMKNDSNSPFNARTKVKFEHLHYYEPDPDFVFKSKLFEYDKKDTIIIFGTKGEERNVVRYGFVKLNYKSDEFKVNVYEGVSKAG